MRSRAFTHPAGNGVRTIHQHANGLDVLAPVGGLAELLVYVTANAQSLREYLVASISLAPQDFATCKQPPAAPRMFLLPYPQVMLLALSASSAHHG